MPLDAVLRSYQSYQNQNGDSNNSDDSNPETLAPSSKIDKFDKAYQDWLKQQNAPSIIDAVSVLEAKNASNAEQEAQGAREGIRNLIGGIQKITGINDLGGILPSQEENTRAINTYNKLYGQSNPAAWGKMGSEFMATLPIMEAGGLAARGLGSVLSEVPGAGRIVDFIGGKTGALRDEGDELLKDARGNLLTNNNLLSQIGSGASKTTNVLASGAASGAGSAALLSGDSDTPLSQQIGQGADIGTVINALTHGISKGAKIGAGAFKNPEDYATGKILQNLMRDKVPLSELQGRLDQAGPEASIMDVAGPNTLRYVDTLANIPGKAQNDIADFLNKRQAGQNNRLLEYATGGLGIDPNVGYEGNVSKLISNREANAAPLYKEVHKDNLPIEDFNNIVKNPIIDKAIRNVTTDPRYRADLPPDLLPEPVSSQSSSRTITISPISDLTKQVAKNLYTPETIDEIIYHHNPSYKVTSGEGVNPRYGYMNMDPVKGSQNVIPEANYKVLDLAKQNIDDQIGLAKRTGEDNVVRILNNAKLHLTNKMDIHNPKYAEAREAYSGPSQSLDAIESGKNFIKNGAYGNAQELSSMSDQDKNFFRIGVGKSISDLLDGTKEGFNAAARLFDTPTKQKALKSVFPNDESFSNFEDNVRKEMKFYENRKYILGGSPTFSRFAASKDAAQESPVSINDLLTAAQGRPGSAALNVGNKLKTLISTLTPSRAEASSRLLFSPNQQSAIQQLIENVTSQGRVNPLLGYIDQFAKKYNVPASVIGLNNLSSIQNNTNKR